MCEVTHRCNGCRFNFNPPITFTCVTLATPLHGSHLGLGIEVQLNVKCNCQQVMRGTLFVRKLNQGREIMGVATIKMM